MAQILINIPDFLYKQILKKHVSKATIARVFQNGVVLPKGHGLEQEPCEDAISLASVFEIMGNLMSIPYDFDRSITEKDVSESMDKIRELPRVTPQEPFKPMVEIDLYSVIKQKYIEREVLDKIRAEIEKQEKWLLQAGYNTYNVDIAFNSIKRALAESEDKG